YELNQLARNGRFAPRQGSGDDAMEAFFETNVMALMAKRRAVHQRAMARQKLRAPPSPQALALVPNKLRVPPVARGAKLLTEDGSVVTVSAYTENGRKRVAVRLGDHTFRTLDPKVMTMPDNPIVDAVRQDPGKDAHLLFHERVAETMEEAARLWQ